MLTSDLLVTRTCKGKIEPVYALPDQENLEIASSVIGVFHGHVGRTYGELLEEAEGFEEINYRLIREWPRSLRGDAL
jgi:predicted nuclease of restriction endonuclease-like RecB superfamily